MAAPWSWVSFYQVRYVTWRVETQAPGPPAGNQCRVFVGGRSTSGMADPSGSCRATTTLCRTTVCRRPVPSAGSFTKHRCQNAAPIYRRKLVATLTISASSENLQALLARSDSSGRGPPGISPRRRRTLSRPRHQGCRTSGADGRLWAAAGCTPGSSRARRPAPGALAAAGRARFPLPCRSTTGRRRPGPGIRRAVRRTRRAAR